MLAQIGIDEVNAVLQSAVKTGNQNTDYRGKMTEYRMIILIQSLEAITGTAISSFLRPWNMKLTQIREHTRCKLSVRVISNPNDEDLIAYVPDYPYVQEIKV